MQILVAVLVAGLMVAGGTFLDRQVGLRTRSQLPRSSVTSGAWFCPHGGGPKGWNVTLEVANPGQSAVTIRVTSIGDGKPGLPASFTVEPGSTLAVPASADGRAASSTVEYFGGWVAVGWVSRAGGGESGVAAEPCTERTASRWFAPDGDTTEGQDAYLIVMNPFSAKAIFDVVVTTTDQAPVRTSDLTDVPLSPDRAVAIH
ncbi:MAG: hypothetical protein HY240_03995, partial [Actinobacteria bacterium]|nr:hypothetical protein [Actinomycetota bacterium]